MRKIEYLCFCLALVGISLTALVALGRMSTRNALLVEDLEEANRQVAVLTEENGDLRKRVGDLEGNVERVHAFMGRYKTQMDPDQVWRISRDAALLYDFVTERDILAMIAIESGFRPQVVSWAGARGAMQVMPMTGREVWRDHLGYDGDPNLFNPRQNILVGAAYLQARFERRGTLWAAVTDYNTGPGAPIRSSARARYWTKYKQSYGMI